MHTLARESPLAAVLSPQFRDSYCATCFSPIESSSETEILSCDDCSEVSYCSLKCQRRDWRHVHQSECEILRSQNSPLTCTMRLCIRILLSDRSAQKPAFNGAVLQDLETNYKEFRSSPQHNQFLTDVLTVISSAAPNIFPDSLDNNKIIAIICAVLCNSFSIIDEFSVEPIGTGMYVGLAKHNHSCASSGHVVFEKDQVILRSREPEYCREITISYVSRMLPTAQRRKSIRNVHFITCRCEMCLDEDLDLIGLASRCRTENCKGFIKNSEVCNICGQSAVIPMDQSVRATEKLLDILENFHKINPDYSVIQEFQELTRIHREYSKILADCNVAILQLDEQIAYCTGNLPNIPEDEELEKIAMRGCEYFIARLGIGSPEVTRRLYIACKCLSRSKNSKSMDFLKSAVNSSVLSHGEQHPISKYLTNFL